MRYTDIQNSPTGYVLRPSAANHAGTVFLATLFMICGGCTLAFVPSIPLAIIGGLLLIGLGLFLLLMAVRRVVIDEEGVHLYRLGRLSRDIPWRHIRAWGIITHKFGLSYHRQKASYLYFSPVKGQTTGSKSIYLEISAKGEAEIAASRIKKYVRKHLSEDDD